VDDVVGSLNVDANANGNGREDDHGEARLILELVDQFLSAVRALAAGACVAVDHGCAESEILLNSVLEFTLDITQFGKENDFVTLPGLFDGLKGIDQPAQLRRVVTQAFVRLNAIGVSTDEFEPVQQAEHAGVFLIKLFFDLLLLAIGRNFREVKISL